MNKNLKEKILFVVTFTAIFIIPNLLFHYFQSNDREVFYRHLAEDNETCRQRAKEDSRETIWCDEIQKAAALTYSETRSSNNTNLLLLMFQPILFVLLFSLYNLRKQVDELKEKIDG